MQILKNRSRFDFYTKSSKIVFKNYFFFFYRLHNKKVYVQMSLKKMVNKHTCKDLQRCIRLEVDGKLVDLPPVEGIIILNILR